MAQESDRATAARGTSSSLGYSRENIQGKGNRSYSPRQEKTYNTDFSSHTPRTEAAADGGRITYHKVVNGETLETIARQHGISLEQLCRQNRLGKFTRVVEGQLLAISK